MRFLTQPRVPLSVTAGLALCGGFSVLAAAAQAQVVVYTNRVAFTTANPGLTTENFNTNVNVNTVIIGPITQSTDSTTGLTIDPGITIQAVGTTGAPGSGSNQIFFNNLSYSTNGTNVLTTNFSTDSQDVTFAPFVTAFGVDLGGTSSGGIYTIMVFNSIGTLLGTTTSNPASSTSAFVGFTSVQAIGRINIASSNFETTDNMSFGTAGGLVSAPEAGAFPLTLLGGTVSFLGSAVLRRNRRR